MQKCLRNVNLVKMIQFLLLVVLQVIQLAILSNLVSYVFG